MLSENMLSEKEIIKNRKTFHESDITMTETFKVLSDIKRYRIFRILAEQPKLSISAIAKIMAISLPLASQHVKVLEQANLLEKEREGKKVFTKLEHNNPFIKNILSTIKNALKLDKLR